MTYATVHEFTMLSPRLARVTATIVGSTGADASAEALFHSLKETASPVKESFRFLNDEKTHVVGYVYALSPVRELPKVGEPFREVSKNLFMDEKDKSLWDVKEGAAGKYIARQGTDNLQALLETARTSPRGSTPRLSAVASVEPSLHEVVAYVTEGRRVAEVDYGPVLAKGDNGTLSVFSFLQEQPVVVQASRVISSHSLDTATLPKIPRKVAAAKLPELAADAMEPKLTPEQYWRLAYSYAPEYVEMVLTQVREQAAL